MEAGQSFLDWLRSRSVWQIGLSYLVSSWVVLEVTATISEVAGLPLWLSRLVLALLSVGLVVVLVTAVVHRTVHLPHRSGRLRARLRTILSWRNVAMSGLAAFALVGVAVTAVVAIDHFGPVSADAGGRRGARWATDVALPRILALAEEGRFEEAYRLAVQAERHIPDNPVLVEKWSEMARYTSIRTEPGGARVEIASYGDPGAAWTELGTTPLDAVRIPVGFFRWRISLEGHHRVEFASSGLRFPLEALHEGFRMAPLSDRPEDMVPVPGGEVSLGIPELFDQPAVTLGPYLLDRHEVTNASFSAFVDAGGYRDSTYWTEPFVRDGLRIGFVDAVREFVDRTGRPGPSTWVGGDYPADRAGHPVVGVSWYEALAYARFMQKEVPTIYHWHRAAGADIASHLVPASNFGGRELASAAAASGLGPFGTYAMAGNAKEWVRNAVGARRYVLGGAWDEPSYLFREAEARSPWDRAPNLGMRLMQTSWPSTPAAAAEMRPSRGPSNVAETSDEVWSAYAALYAYDRTDLDAIVERVDTVPDGVRERVSFRAAYGGERVPALLYLPASARPPYQVVVAFPGSSALAGGAVEASSHLMIDYMVKAGRAVILPVYKGTYERSTGLEDDNPDSSLTYRDHVVMWSKDLGRSIDYLESRPDVDASRIGYFGSSWGAGIGVVLAAVEPRLGALVLDAGGFWSSSARPEADQRVFAPRVRAPVLLLGGRFDPFFPLETSQLPLYDALGTSEADKRHVVFESGHAVPRLEAVRETDRWFDRYLGSVR